MAESPRLHEAADQISAAPRRGRTQNKPLRHVLSW